MSLRTAWPLVLLVLASCETRGEAQESRRADTLHRDCRSSACARGQTCLVYSVRGRRGIQHTCEIRCQSEPCPTGLECRASGDDRGRVCFAPAGEPGRRALEAAGRAAVSRQAAEQLLVFLENLPFGALMDENLGALARHCADSPLCRPNERACAEVLAICREAPRTVCEYGVSESCSAWTAGRSLVEAVRTHYADAVRTARPALPSDAERARLDAAWAAIDRRLR